MMLKTTTESPMMSPTGCTKCPAIKDKNDESAADETQEIFRDNNIMGGKMRWGQGCSQRPGQQMEIHRDEQSAKK